MPLGAQTSFPRKTWIASIVAVGGAVLFAVAPAAAAPKTSIPKSNLIDNPTFKRSVAGWAGMDASVKRVTRVRAPNGKHAALVTAVPRASAYTLDDATATVDSVPAAGATYQGSAWVKAGRKSRGKSVSLVVREWDEAGGYVDSESETVELSRRFAQVSTEYAARARGGEIDVYVARTDGGVSNRESFYADAITLVRGRAGGASTPSNDPVPNEISPEDIPPAPINPTGGVTTSQIALLSSHEEALLAERGSKYRYLVLRDTLNEHLEDLRAAHPEAQILLYKDFGLVNREPGCPWAPFQGSGVSWCDADPQESWFLHRSDGQRIESEGYAGMLAMDISDASYRQRWAESVLGRLADAHGDGSNVRYDGVWMDDVNLFPGHGADGEIAELTDDQYRAEMVEAVHAVSPRLTTKGFLTVANVAMNPWEQDQRASALDLADVVSGLHREGLVRWSTGAFFNTTSGPSWLDEVTLAEQIQARGADFHALTYGSSGDVQAQRYGRATFLLAWNGNDGSAYAYRPSGTGNAYLPDWTTDVGVPTSPRYRVGGGWRRDFANGTVVINPQASGSVSFPLGGSFRKPDGSCTSSVGLGPTQALVMPRC